jgi:anti-anti-sigma factor
MSIAQLAIPHSEIADSLARRLSARTASAFRRVGTEVCREYVDAALSALRTDLESGKREAVRTVMQELVEDLAKDGLTFADVRFFAQALRSEVSAALASEPETLRQQAQDWLFELLMVASTRFLAHREEHLQQRAVKLEVQRLESQLEELRTALVEKERLFEMIRQASTPIAPVVKGILVVPLVGIFDTFRAEIVTEKLLHEVARTRARAVILDITGVQMFDTDAAQLIIRLANAVRLLGAELILVGMSPDNARTIVDLGISLTHFKTLATLQDGLAHALLLQRMKIVQVSTSG